MPAVATERMSMWVREGETEVSVYSVMVSVMVAMAMALRISQETPCCGGVSVVVGCGGLLRVGREGRKGGWKYHLEDIVGVVGEGLVLFFCLLLGKGMVEQPVGGDAGRGLVYHDPFAIEVFERFVCWGCHLVVEMRGFVRSKDRELGTGRRTTYVEHKELDVPG